MVPPQLTKTAGPEHRPRCRLLPRFADWRANWASTSTTCAAAGPGGRILEEDVKAYAKSVIGSAGAAIAGAAMGSGFVPPAPQLPDFCKWGPIEKVPCAPSAARPPSTLPQAWNTIPHVTQHDLADITELEELRQRFLRQGRGRRAAR